MSAGRFVEMPSSPMRGKEYLPSPRRSCRVLCAFVQQRMRVGCDGKKRHYQFRCFVYPDTFLHRNVLPAVGVQTCLRLRAHGSVGWFLDGQQQFGYHVPVNRAQVPSKNGTRTAVNCR